MMNIYNFGSGPGMMPQEVLRQAQDEMLNWNNSGVSVMELPFTGDAFQAIADRAKDDLRDLLNIPSNFKILFLQGGASAQFSLVPMNLLAGIDKPQANYIDSGYWSRKAIKEARRYCEVNVVPTDLSGKGPLIALTEQRAVYCHVTSNETAEGIQFDWSPLANTAPLVADMSSDFLSRAIDFDRFGLIYAGAQKNIGPAGLTIVVIREDLIRDPMPTTPSAFSYQVIAETNGRFNTPLTHAIYIAGLVFQHLKNSGGIAAAQQRNKTKSQRLYRTIDRSDFYQCQIHPNYRSQMNICFELVAQRLTKKFLSQAQQQGLINLGGHSAAGGIRASLYNAMPLAGVIALEKFMLSFASEHQDAV